ncbi:hypothetical protein [Bacillus benzoevorans]|uniref:Uncharacterized protein n=1 Tax=Bacillus benzoevorans TaxID=1456 RepID=A0A7X0HVN8_9BACI|nr:hypothetical protein [Bacillus benzoevorans]MBB6447678.1 hypothetical protein [Bacillus benzoevorans]
MKKGVPLLLFLFSSVLFCWINNGTVYANLDDMSSLEEMYTQIGYKTVEEAVIEFENHFKKDVKLPFLC